MKLAWLFPGQGAQYVGMGQLLADKFPAARAVFDEADEVLGFSIRDLCFRGPEDALRVTYHTQPALLTTSVAAWRVFTELTGVTPVVAAGHSLGEYSALVAAGALSFADAVQLVYWRGRWMDEAYPAGQGAMAAVLGLDAGPLAEVCVAASHDGDIVELANLNCPGQVVISGTAGAVARAGEMAKARGARRVIPLVVSGPFHCSLMRPAAGQLSAALRTTPIADAHVPVVANVDAVPHTAPDDIRRALEAQLYSPVRFEDNVRTMMDMGVDTFVEFGAGTVLSGLVKKVDRQLRTFHVEDEASLQETVAAVTGQ